MRTRYEEKALFSRLGHWMTSWVSNVEFGCAQRRLDAGLLLQLICCGCDRQSNLLHRSSKTRQAMKKFNVDYIVRLSMRSGNMKLDRRRIRSQGRSEVLNESWQFASPAQWGGSSNSRSEPAFVGYHY